MSRKVTGHLYEMAEAFMEPVPGLMERRDSGQRYGWFGPGQG